MLGFMRAKETRVFSVDHIGTDGREIWPESTANAWGGCHGNPMGRFFVEWAWGWVASGNMMQSLNHGDASSGCQWGVRQAKRTLTRGKPALDPLQPQGPWRCFTTGPSCQEKTFLLFSPVLPPHHSTPGGVRGGCWAERGEWEDKECWQHFPLSCPLAGAGWSWGRREKGYL